MPAIDRSSGSGDVRGGINISYDNKSDEKNQPFVPAKGITVKASEYVITERDSGVYKLESEDIVDGGL